MVLVAKKQTILTVPKESDSESENVSPTVTSKPVKSKTIATTLKTNPVNSRKNWELTKVFFRRLVFCFFHQ